MFCEVLNFVSNGIPLDVIQPIAIFTSRETAARRKVQKPFVDKQYIKIGSSNGVMPQGIHNWLNQCWPNCFIIFLYMGLSVFNLLIYLFDDYKNMYDLYFILSDF